MHTIDHIYINGRFVRPHGSERLDLIDPTSEECIGQVVLGDVQDAQLAVEAAKNALPTFAQTTKADRIAMLDNRDPKANTSLACLVNFGGP